ncbi:hypothetical protein TSUD_268920 [Trifolium subterraneum]|uniref:Uncharacterized protein n=1 Tax=Trifolium subterraneum TaxID=3900 RepID=A0A2Z6MET3_TRISU|nr:hypothetical protein TSUD_268920 [Trifolium subterraneum]
MSLCFTTVVAGGIGRRQHHLSFISIFVHMQSSVAVNPSRLSSNQNITTTSSSYTHEIIIDRHPMCSFSVVTSLPNDERFGGDSFSTNEQFGGATFSTK